MTNTTVDQPGTVALEPPSTVLNPQTVSTSSGGGQPPLSEPEGNQSIESVLDAEIASIKEAEDKVETEAKDKADKAADEAKEKLKADKDADKSEGEKDPKADKAKAEEPKADMKPAEADAKADKSAADKPAAEQDSAASRQSEGPHAAPPARFLPEARVKWGNVPNEIKAEFHRVSQEYEGEIQKSRAVSERYEPIRQFDEIARSNGRELKDSLTKVAQIEQQLARNPIAGLEMIMREIGPRKADGSQLSLYEVAQAIAKQTPQQYQATMAQFGGQQPQARQQQANPEVAALKGELSELKTMLMSQQVNPIIERFAAQHSDYQSLENEIAKILKSKIIEQIHGTGLTPEQRLAQAYRMAGGRGPASRSDTSQVEAGHSGAETVPSKDAGTKSIRGAPSDGTDVPVEEDTSDLREMLRKDLRKLTA